MHILVDKVHICCKGKYNLVAGPFWKTLELVRAPDFKGQKASSDKLGQSGIYWMETEASKGRVKN